MDAAVSAQQRRTVDKYLVDYFRSIGYIYCIKIPK